MSYGYTSRPALNYYGTLHVATIMFIRGLLKTDREYLMAAELTSIYERQDKERTAEV